ncbi:MAG: TRAP transporter large permease subunit [Enterocloster sp.]
MDIREDKRYTPGEIWQIILKAIPGLMIPVIILGGIYGGVFTPTEAAAIAGVYGVIVGLFIYREIKPSDLIYIMYRSVLMCAPVLLIIGISTGFGRILTITQVPVMIADAILGLTSSKILVLLLINVLLLIVGTFMRDQRGHSAILTPILLPIVTRLGVNPIHFGIIVVMNLSIGFITPPLGANLFMACQVGEISFDKLARKIWPWIVASSPLLASLRLSALPLLMLVTYIPQISMALPGAMGVIRQ